MNESRREAFLSIVKPVRIRMFRAIWRVIRNCDDAEDVLQEALLTAWNKFERVRKHTRPDLLLLRIGTDKAIDLLRKRMRKQDREGPLEDLPPQPAEYDSPREALEEKEQRRQLLEKIAALPRKQALGVFLRYIEECSHREIASTLGCREATARSHVSKGVAKLKQSMAKETP